ncbi:putative holin-like toxin [Desulfosporosinus sp.]
MSVYQTLSLMSAFATLVVLI